eukprot:1171961-Prorocentrum_minimum.AAC.1
MNCLLSAAVAIRMPAPAAEAEGLAGLHPAAPGGRRSLGLWGAPRLVVQEHRSRHLQQGWGILNPGAPPRQFTPV